LEPHLNDGKPFPLSELNDGKVLLRDIIDLDATYGGPDAKALPTPEIGPDGQTIANIAVPGSCFSANQLSRKVLSTLDRLGCLSFRAAAVHLGCSPAQRKSIGLPCTRAGTSVEEWTGGRDRAEGHGQMAKHTRVFQGKEESDIETQFSKWQQANAGLVFNIKKHPTERLSLPVQRPGFEHRPVKRADTFSMRVEYETKDHDRRLRKRGK